MKWFKLAAEQGHVDAQFKLGALYYDGRGVTQDYIRLSVGIENIAA